MTHIPESHPRAESLKFREIIERNRELGLVAAAGPIAHGRGEAFDYILGEETVPCVKADIYAAAAMLLNARYPVISVNGNTAVLVPELLLSLSEVIPAKLEVNVFYGRTLDREKKIADLLISKGATGILGVNPEEKVPHLHSSRAKVDKNGIAVADVVLVPLEDGDRTQALIAWGKKVISIDLNPLSRTATDATLNICDNITRAFPLLEKAVIELTNDSSKKQHIMESFDSRESRYKILEHMENRVRALKETVRL